MTDIAYVATVDLPGRYWSAQFYVVVPGEWESKGEESVRSMLGEDLKTLAFYAPDAKLEITNVRKLGPVHEAPDA